MVNMESYRTRDLYLATTLYSLGYPILRIDKVGDHFHFVFDYGAPGKQHPVDIEETLEKYWAHELLIDPLVLFTSFKELKNRLYNT